MLGIGLFAVAAVNTAGRDGLFFGGGAELLGKQALACVATAAYAFIVTWIIAKVIDKTMGFRATRDDEIVGLDVTQHAESAYDLAGVAGGGILGGSHPLRDRKQGEQ
jgi:Amt family ammonium transporter